MLFKGPLFSHVVPERLLLSNNIISLIAGYFKIYSVFCINRLRSEYKKICAL